MEIQIKERNFNYLLESAEKDLRKEQVKSDAWKSASILADEAACYLDHAEALIQILMDCFFDTIKPEWDVNYGYPLIQGALFLLSGAVSHANAMLYAGMGTEHNYLNGMRISVKEMEDTIQKLKEIQS